MVLSPACIRVLWGTFQKYQCQGPTPTILNYSWVEPKHQYFISSPDNSSVRPRLGASDNPEHHPLTWEKLVRCWVREGFLRSICSITTCFPCARNSARAFIALISFETVWERHYSCHSQVPLRKGAGSGDCPRATQLGSGNAGSRAKGVSADSALMLTPASKSCPPLCPAKKTRRKSTKRLMVNIFCWCDYGEFFLPCAFLHFLSFDQWACIRRIITS